MVMMMTTIELIFYIEKQCAMKTLRTELEGRRERVWQLKNKNILGKL